MGAIARHAVSIPAAVTLACTPAPITSPISTRSPNAVSVTS
jgi:hypothetical protein